jgi:hypothetical protein
MRTENNALEDWPERLDECVMIPNAETSRRENRDRDTTAKHGENIRPRKTKCLMYPIHVVLVDLLIMNLLSLSSKSCLHKK